MKNVFRLFIILLFTCSISVFAQNFAKKGTIELGGSIGFNSTTSVVDGETDDESTTTLLFNPYFGYFIIDKLEFGIIPSYISSSYRDQSQSTFALLFAPSYNFDLGNCWYPFIEGRIGYNTTTIDDGSPLTDDYTASGLVWGFRGGTKVQVGNNALVNVGLFYSNITRNPEGWDRERIGSNVFGIEVGVAIFIN